MIELAASEVELVHLTRGIVGLGGSTRVLLRSQAKLSEPSPGCVRLLRSTLAGGVVRRLAAGNWQVRDGLSGGEHGGDKKSGRLWERHQAPTLEFSESSELLLRWLTSHDVIAAPALSAVPKTVGDDILFFLALSAAENASCGGAVAKQKGTRRSPLCWLGFPELMAANWGKRQKQSVSDFVAKTVFGKSFSRYGDGMVLEALSDELAERWREVEFAKSEITRNSEMIELGNTQTAVLGGYLEAIDGFGRRDLARFIVRAGAAVAEAKVTAAETIGNLESRRSISERVEAMKAAAAFLEQLETVARWADAAATTNYIDDDYVAAQIFAKIWETMGAARMATIRELVHNLTSLTAVSTPSESEKSKNEET